MYDSSRIYPLEAVTVLSTSGKGAFTNSMGGYEIDVREKDSVWFSYLGKPTMKFSVLKMTDPLHFDIALHINVTVLKGVTVMPRDYRRVLESEARTAPVGRPLELVEVNAVAASG